MSQLDASLALKPLEEGVFTALAEKPRGGDERGTVAHDTLSAKPEAKVRKRRSGK